MQNKVLSREKDMLHSFLVKDSDYDGFLELPKIKTSDIIPNKVITFSKAMAKNTTDYNQWVIFYEHDEKFERLWNNPKHYLEKLKKFKGVVSPDFSLYRNMPLCFQIWNTYRGRALANWLQSNKVEVIPNIRWGDERTYLFAFSGVELNKTISIGTHGCIKRREDKEYFKRGLAKAVEKLNPRSIIIYGAMPDEIFRKYKEQGIEFIHFESEFSKSRRRVNA